MKLSVEARTLSLKGRGLEPAVRLTGPALSAVSALTNTLDLSQLNNQIFHHISDVWRAQESPGPIRKD